MALTQDELKKILHYDPETGIFTWLISPARCVKVGDRAGYMPKADAEEQYIKIAINYKYYRAHRLAWLYMYGKLPKHTIDHIDGNGTNNKLANLRDVPQKENVKNRKQSIRNKSGMTGIFWRRNRWEVAITINREIIYLGVHPALLDAACARKSAEIRYGFHKNHGRQLCQIS